MRAHPAGSGPGTSLDDAAALRGQRLRELVAAVVHGPGVLPGEVREALVTGTAPPPELADFVAEIADGGHAVTDDGVAALLGAGYDDDALFECVVAVAVGAGLTRLRVVDRLLASSP